MGVGDNISFRAVNFGGGGNSSRSFTERIDRKERYKMLDARADARDAENKRRYEEAQIMRNNVESRAMNLFERNKIRDIAIEGRAVAQEKRNQANEDRNIASSKRDIKHDDYLNRKYERDETRDIADVAVQDNYADTIMDTNTELADSINEGFKQANNAPDITLPDGSTMSATEDLTRNVIAAHDAGKIDLNSVTNASQFGSRLTSNLVEQNATPQQIDTMVATATGNAKGSDKLMAENLKAANKMSKDSYDASIKTNNELQNPGEYDLAALASLPEVKNSGNPWTGLGDAYEGIKTNKKGKVSLVDGNEEVGTQEFSKFARDIMEHEFTVGKNKDIKLTQKQLKRVIAEAFYDNPVGANHIDAEKAFIIAQEILVNDKSKSKKRKDSALQADYQKSLGTNAEAYSRRSGADIAKQVLGI